jgi:hypothetical protein
MTRSAGILTSLRLARAIRAANKKLRNFSAATQKLYLYAATRLTKYYGKAPDQLDKEQIRAIPTGKKRAVVVTVAFRFAILSTYLLGWRTPCHKRLQAVTA